MTPARAFLGRQLPTTMLSMSELPRPGADRKLAEKEEALLIATGGGPHIGRARRHGDHDQIRGEHGGACLDVHPRRRVEDHDVEAP